MQLENGYTFASICKFRTLDFKFFQVYLVNHFHDWQHSYAVLKTKKNFWNKRKYILTNVIEKTVLLQRYLMSNYRKLNTIQQKTYIFFNL